MIKALKPKGDNMDAVTISTMTLAITAAVAISVVLIIRSSSSKVEALESSDSWTCDTCGGSNPSGDAECSHCGMEKSI
jgi:ubiquitin C-terminal hydrolase